MKWSASYSRSGALIGAAAANGACKYEPCLSPAAGVLVSGLAYGGIGALIDHFVKGRTVVFRVPGTAVRLRPEVAVGVRAVRMSVALTGR